MSFYTLQDARDAYQRRQRAQQFRETASQYLHDEVAKTKPDEKFDIFLSHSLRDAETIAGVKLLLEAEGHKVYVDWIVDTKLDRTKVTPATADVLRHRMRSSSSFLFATSESSPQSKWMPWELGYFDGLRQGRIAILPLVAYSGAGFTGQEYLGLYPVVEKLSTEGGIMRPFVTPGLGDRRYIELGSFGSGNSVFRAY